MAMLDFFSAMPPDMLLEYVRERQEALSAQAEGVRQRARPTPERLRAPVVRFVRRLRRATTLSSSAG
jgi:hypothetical protein